MNRPHIVVAGQFPPPIGGQNINIKRVHDLLKDQDEYRVSHWKFAFTRGWGTGRKAQTYKVIELIRVFWRLLKIRAAGKIDFILFPAGGPHLIPILRDIFLIPWAALFSRRVCIHFRAAGIAERLDVAPSILNRIAVFVYKNFATEAAVLTEYGRRDAEAVKIEKIWLLPNGVEDRSVHSSEKVESDEEITILSVGHLCVDKGTPDLIQAFSQIAGDFPNIRLRLVGEPLAPYSGSVLDDEIEQTGYAERIELVGIKEGEALGAEYSNCDFFVFSTIAPYESFGMVLIEAMMWGKPIVVTDWRGNTQVVGSPFGGAVAKVAGGELSRNLAHAMKSTLENRTRWSEWGELNRKIFLEKYTTATLLGNLKKMIGDQRPGANS